jgi:rhamnogalacturonyl hydrolase YesR
MPIATDENTTTGYRLSPVLILLAGVFVAGCSALGDERRPGAARERTAAVMAEVGAYQYARLNALERDPRGWVYCTFFTGMMAAYESTRDRSYLLATKQWAKANQWQLGARPRHADDHCGGQVYLELFRFYPESRIIEPTRSSFDRIMTDPRPGRVAWHWADAIFMAPPTLARLGAITGEKRYFRFLDVAFWDAADFLFDDDAGLYYRDENSFDRRSPNGEGLFWSRGNGWVLAGLARVLQYLPHNDPARVRFEEHFRTMAEAVVPLQGEDGLWRANLLDPATVSNPETSGTGLFCYALAWGINTGLLQRETYRPVVERAWAGLTASVHSNGKLGWVQPIGGKPEPATFEDTQAYGAGAFLLAGSEVLRMTE